MNIQAMMQKAQAMQKQMEEMTKRFEALLVTGQSGGGMVKIEMTCKGVVNSVQIQPDIMDPKDPGLLEDLVKAAINDARTKADTRMAEESQQMMGSIGLPGNMKWPF